ncbi:MAG: hypothetical protein C0425_01505 [Chlorobiaceae bacterium]|nr:hypothetical protein [Chlorobiaceae bacterium]MBA4308995.1 hypothetical protein [Chlorobiaceae bacterium]
MKRSEKLYSVSAIFNSPDDIISAAKKTEAAGYKNWDVHTPYPIHGMDNAMKLKPSKLGYVTLTFGLTGAVVALLFMYWALSINYPMNIGGKPFFALPAFIPVTFEVTVLLATVCTVLGMITFFFWFPNNSHPLHDTQYMKTVAVDKFGITIEASDPQFDEAKVSEFLRSIGSTSLEKIYFPIEEKRKVFEPKFIFFLVAITFVVSGSTYFALNKLMYMDPFNWMMEQDRLNPQHSSEMFKDNFGMRPPVEGTVARGYLPYEFKGKPEPTVPLVNPVFPTEKALALGKKKYDTFCSSCHGWYGDGAARLNNQYPNPPSFHSAKVVNWADGNIYHVIVNGQNVMSSYAALLTPEERWSVVLYIRALQRAKNATVEDIKKIK